MQQKKDALATVIMKPSRKSCEGLATVQRKIYPLFRGALTRKQSSPNLGALAADLWKGYSAALEEP